jgi:hypothetical protein
MKPLPHPFLERTPDVVVPSLTYAPIFYPGASSFAGATQLLVSSGLTVSGIDFKMSSVVATGVRGHLSASDPKALQGNLQMILQSRDPRLRNVLMFSALVQKSGKFHFPNVSPGSYDLTAQVRGLPYYAETSIDVGTAPMEPVEMELASSPTLTGSITVDRDSNVAMENLQINLNPVEFQYAAQPQNVKVQKDGTFVIPGVAPGKWQLNLNGVAGYIKSISLNDEEILEDGFNVSGAGGKLKIVLGTKWVQLDGSVIDAPDSGETPVVIVWPDKALQRRVLRRAMTIDEKHHFQGSMPPGKYHACAVIDPQAWALLENTALLQKLESHCESFELAEGGQTTVQAPLISNSDLDSLQQEQ